MYTVANADRVGTLCLFPLEFGGNNGRLTSCGGHLMQLWLYESTIDFHSKL